jgi:hypothetical protein
MLEGVHVLGGGGNHRITALTEQPRLLAVDRDFVFVNPSTGRPDADIQAPSSEPRAAGLTGIWVHDLRRS